MVKYKEYLPFLLLALLAIISFLIIQPFLTSLFLGALLAYVFYSPYKKILSKIKSESISAFLICLIVFIIILIPGFFFLKSLIQESYFLYILAKQKLATGILTNCENNFCQMIKSFSESSQLNQQIQDGVKLLTNFIVKKGSNLLLSLPNLLISLFIIMFTIFYSLKDGRLFVKKIGNILSMKKKKYVFLLRRLKEIIHGVVYGYAIIALMQGLLGGIGFFLFGIPSPIFWGMVMAIFALIPFIGTGIIWVPASLLLIFDGVFQGLDSLIFKGIGLFVFSFIFVSSLDNFLRPKLMSDKAKVHPLILFLGVLGGILFFGPVGVIVGPLILSLTVVFVDTYINEK